MKKELNRLERLIRDKKVKELKRKNLQFNKEIVGYLYLIYIMFFTFGLLFFLTLGSIKGGFLFTIINLLFCFLIENGFNKKKC